MHLPTHLGTVVWFRQPRTRSPLGKQADWVHTAPCILECGQGTQGLPRGSWLQVRALLRAPFSGPAGPYLCLPLTWADCPQLHGWLTGVCAGTTVVIEVTIDEQQWQDARHMGGFCIARHCGHLAPHRDGPRLPRDPEPQDNAVPIREPPRTLHLLAQCWAGMMAVMSPQQKPALAFPCQGSCPAAISP